MKKGILVGLGLLAATGSAPAQPVRMSAYKVAPGFKNVPNFAAMQKKVRLTAAQQKMLEKNLLVARPADWQQLTYVYENNDYLSLPSFVTTDTVLQLYHIFFDYTLRTAEKETFLPALQKLNNGMLAACIEQWKTLDDAKLKVAALKNVAFFVVADRQLGQKSDAPEEAVKLAAVDLGLIAKHEGWAVSGIFPYKIDYSQFITRGHYTRSVELRRYFGAMMWLGLAPFAMRDENGNLLPEQIRQGLLWTRALYSSKLDGAWRAIYEPTVFYVGAADDLTPADFKKAGAEVFGPNAALSAYADDKKIAPFATAIDKIASPRIVPNFEGLWKMPGQPQLRFMGQRYIPDSEILQRLIKECEPPKPVNCRVFPCGLDVMSVFGNQRATQILDAYPEIYNTNKWKDYVSERTKITAEFSKLPHATWVSNLYWGWLHALRALQTPAPVAAPSFMKNVAWQDKSLNTALASWAELRHDTILYAKQSVTAECGGESEEPPLVKGYVEPNVEFYKRLLALTLQSRDGLKSRGLLPKSLVQPFEEFEDLLTFLKKVSEKELRGEKLTRDEYLEIRYFGGKLDALNAMLFQGADGLVSDTDKSIALVADVHTGPAHVLEEGVGNAMEIYVVVPIEGKLVLTRGATFSYYEFKHPIDDRLTDEKWQSLLKAGKAPLQPVWTKSFIAPGPPGKVIPSGLGSYNSGC